MVIKLIKIQLCSVKKPKGVIPMHSNLTHPKFVILEIYRQFFVQQLLKMEFHDIFFSFLPPEGNTLHCQEVIRLLISEEVNASFQVLLM